MATGIVIRKLNDKIKNKWQDNPILVIDRELNHSIPLIGGHHGANKLSKELFESLNIYPAITTATETLGKNSLEKVGKKLDKTILNKDSSKEINKKIIETRNQVPIVKVKGSKIVLIDKETAVLKDFEKKDTYILGIGSKSGVGKKQVLNAIKQTLKENNFSKSNIRALTTAENKKNEKGIIKAAEELGKPLFIVPKKVINQQEVKTKSKAKKIGLIGVAEPTALSLSINNKLVVEKEVHDEVTTAIAR